MKDRVIKVSDDHIFHCLTLFYLPMPQGSLDGAARGAQLLYALSLPPTVCPEPAALATQCVRRMEASNSSFSMTYVMILFSLTIIVSLCYRGRKTSSLRAVKVKDRIKSTIKEYGHNLSNAVSL